MSDAAANSTFDVRLLAVGRRRSGAQRLEEEVTALFEQWRGALLRYLSTFGLPQQDAEEIAQEVFLSLFSHLQKDRARTNLRGWIFRVAHNLALSRRDAERKAAGTALDVANLRHPGLNPEEELASSRRQQHLSNILRALPERDRQCLYFRAEGFPYREIAEVLGISLGSVAASLERSLARFQRADQR